jgi:hypothetical protein
MLDAHPYRSALAGWLRLFVYEVLRPGGRQTRKSCKHVLVDGPGGTGSDQEVIAGPQIVSNAGAIHK